MRYVAPCPCSVRTHNTKSLSQFSKHATCTSTFDIACYGPDYQKNQDVVDFFEAVVRAFKMFPTFDMLAASGIFPSNKTTYSLSQIQTALKAQTGAIPYLGCGSNGTVLQEVWYFNHVIGTVRVLQSPPLRNGLLTVWTGAIR